MTLTKWLRHVHVAIAILGSLLCLDQTLAEGSGADSRPMLQVPVTDSQPAVDRKLDEPCWKDAVKTGFVLPPCRLPSQLEVPSYTPWQQPSANKTLNARFM